MRGKYYHRSYLSPHKGVEFYWKSHSKGFWIDIKLTNRKHRFYWSEERITR